MGAALKTLAALEIAVRSRGTALAGRELVGIHRKAHRATGFTPVEAGFAEYRIQAFSLGLRFHEARSGDDHGTDVGVDRPAIRHARNLAQILDAGVGAGADED